MEEWIEVGKIGSSEKVVVVVTGSGLKDVMDVKSVFGHFPTVEVDVSIDHILSLV
ncbi:MAG: hypothetical protein QXG36_02205 [Nitrososphaeria archaeon]